VTEVFVVIGFETFLPLGFWLLAQAEAIQAPPDGPAPAAAANPESAPEWWTIFANPLNLMLLALGLFWLIVILPQQRSMRAKQLAMQKMLDELKKNDRVITSAGIHGTVVATSPESGTVTLRIDDSTNARLTVNRNTIVRVGEVNSKE
jgi:preprotein translocase YajC subunit